MSDQTKFEILNCKWINIKTDTGNHLINLNSLSNISAYSKGINEETHKIVLAPNAGIYSENSDDSYAIWNTNFIGGKYIITYEENEKEIWENDFKKIIEILDK